MDPTILSDLIEWTQYIHHMNELNTVGFSVLLFLYILYFLNATYQLCWKPTTAAQSQAAPTHERAVLKSV